MTSSLEKPKKNPSLRSISVTRTASALRLGQAGRQLQPAEPGPQDHDVLAHRAPAYFKAADHSCFGGPSTAGDAAWGKLTRVSIELAVVLFDGEGKAVERYADARDRSSSHADFGAAPAWTRDVGFVERHHNGHLLMRGMFAGHYLDVDEGDHVSQKGTWPRAP